MLSQKKGFSDIASACVEVLGRTEYRAFIEEEFDKEFGIERISSAYKELFKLKLKTIITTNIDRIPERLNGTNLATDPTASSSNSSYYRVFTNRNAVEANNAWKQKKPIVFKAHGCVSDHDSIVFTVEEFRRIIYQHAVSSFLETIFRARTVIFVGFGFSDPHIDSILSFLYEANKGLGSPHYVLMNNLSRLQKRLLEQKYEVRVINYIPSSKDYPEVPELLRLLGTID